MTCQNTQTDPANTVAPQGEEFATSPAEQPAEPQAASDGQATKAYAALLSAVLLPWRVMLDLLRLCRVTTAWSYVRRRTRQGYETAKPIARRHMAKGHAGWHKTTVFMRWLPTAGMIGLLVAAGFAEAMLLSGWGLIAAVIATVVTPIIAFVRRLLAKKETAAPEAS